MRTDQTPTESSGAPPAGPGMLSPAEVARLAPHLEERRLALGLGTDRAPTSRTYGQIMRGRPIQRATCAHIDERLAGPPGGPPDGLWPPGTALWLATGRVGQPGLRPGYQPPAGDPAEVNSLIVRGAEIITRVPSASPEQRRRVREFLDAAWAELDERQGR